MTSSLSLSNSIDLTPRLLSYNINSLGFYASDHNNRSRSARVHSTLRELLKTQDIICLQETNLHSEESCALSHFKTEGASVSLNNFSKGSAGTAIIDSYHVTRLYNPTDVLLPVICAGYAQMRLYTAAPESGRSSFAIINVYLKTGGHYEFNAKILQSLRAVKIDVPVFACGDFNFVNRAEDTSSSSWRSPPLAFLSVWQSFLSAFDLSEMLHDRHTFYHIAPDAFSWSSRLDRFLVPPLSFVTPFILLLSISLIIIQIAQQMSSKTCLPSLITFPSHFRSNPMPQKLNTCIAFQTGLLKALPLLRFYAPCGIHLQ